MYDKGYYEKHQDGSYQSASRILRFLNTLIRFETVIDFGCGMGTWGVAAKELGARRYIGIDQHEYDISYMQIDPSEYWEKNLQLPIHVEHFYDLAICVEVAEHIPEDYANTLIDNICLGSETILFSAALPYQGGTGHVNEQPCSYWVNKFLIKGYKPIDCIRPIFWNDAQVEVWYRNNCMLYVTEKASERIKVHLPAISFPSDIVHPQMLTRILHKRGLL